ncbi:unnamed protein product, partial [Rotaria socialis]
NEYRSTIQIVCCRIAALNLCRTSV